MSSAIRPVPGRATHAEDESRLLRRRAGLLLATSLFFLSLGGCLLDWSRNPDPPLTPCPVEEPEDDAACSSLTQECEYGLDPRPLCRTVRVCTSEGWVRKCEVPGEPSCVDDCPAVASSDCPETPNLEELFELCDIPEGLACVTDDAQGQPVQCGCVHCEIEDCMAEPFEWYCSTGAEQPDCPEVAPQFGQACDTEGLSCVYGSVKLQTLMRRECRNGIWLKY